MTHSPKKKDFLKMLWLFMIELWMSLNLIGEFKNKF